ncbi:uncharacterized protein OCT59_000688 [Rhizophagus irregularis]|uniref:uncharacterized protein n=1 Tax=Rhizophagus irregularis TaxID=588596 RepID=UPI001A097BD3|nr:hypothetical protein OCT59_000287 [Rhizophagus irregularis]UZN99414.1 hypothetical protein OCT59_000688 [Rhizophagus irregularis]GBC13572.2 hypothetical protein GLOIN_2v1834793 [Rhizophagus irregularis DAOM 181602=DAOM 197198]GBC17753.2 hypothetical protein GLOIN_2v1834793 [Rhizophagus irregularis DAOM 181602=DAOM 197198]GBC47881.2 hypothetical protein GLOIN_2v1834793 [Rhizophagus irregularis DAOM 181602=DAOM 197198]
MSGDRSEFRNKIQKLLSAGEETSNKRRGIESSMSSTSSMSENSYEVFNEQLIKLNKKVDNMIEQNKQFNTKLIEENVKTNKHLEFLCNRMKHIEEMVESDNSGDNNFIKTIIKDVAKATFNISIYPTKEELREATEEFLKIRHQDFYNKFTTKTQWISYFNNKICPELLSKQRSLRSCLTTKARDALFSYFGEVILPPINTNTSSAGIIEWKNHPAVAECYNKLFNQNGSLGVLTRILERVFAGEYPSSLHLAFVTATFAVLLDPKSKTIQTNENTMKNKIEYYMKLLDDDRTDGKN